jgi:hypothetical protein
MVDVWKNRAEAMKAAASRKGTPSSKPKPSPAASPSAYHAKNAIQVSKEDRLAKAMGARYPTGKKADAIMKAAADRRANKSAVFAKNKADKTTGGKGASPFDSSEDQKKYNDVRTAASKQSPDPSYGY